MTVGSTLKYHRRKLNLSQVEVSHKLHVSRQSISSWENDHSCPSLDNLISLSGIYQTSIEDLLKDNEQLIKKLTVHNKQLLEYEQKIYKIKTQVDNLDQDLNYDKEDEFLLGITLIFIGIALAPLGLVIPIIYYINKKKKKERRDYLKKITEKKWFYWVVAFIILLFYFLFYITKKNIFLIAFFVSWISFNIYGLYLIIHAINKKSD